MINESLHDYYKITKKLIYKANTIKVLFDDYLRKWPRQPAIRECKTWQENVSA